MNRAVPVLVATLCAAAGEVPPAVEPASTPLLPADPVPPPSPDELVPPPPPATEAVAPPRRDLGSTLRGFGAVGTGKSDEDRWAGWGGALALDLWYEPPDWASAMALRLSLEGGAYGGAAALAAIFAFGKAPIRPYLGGMVGLGAFAAEPGLPLSVLAGLEWSLPWRISLAVEGRAHVFGYEDDNGNSHGFAAASLLFGLGVRL